MILTPRDSPLPPHEMDFFLFFCNDQEKADFLDFISDIPGPYIGDEGTLKEDDKQECSFCGKSRASLFALVIWQKPNFGASVIPDIQEVD